MILSLIHPSPFLVNFTYNQKNYELKQTITYYYNDILIVTVFLIVPYQINEIFNASIYNSPRIQRINMIFNNRNLNYSMPIKNYIANQPIFFMVISFIFSVFYFSALVLVSERQTSKVGDKNLENWNQSMWYILVTMATIGYGDIVAKTLVARLICMVVVIWGNFWASIFLTSIYPFIVQNIKEKKAYNLFNRIQIQNKIKDISAKLIQNFFKIWIYNKNKKNTNKIEALNNKMLFLLDKRRRVKKEMIGVVHQTFYFIDDLLLDLENLTTTTEDQLFKVEKVFKNIQNILLISSKKIKSIKAKKSINGLLSIMKLDPAHIYMENDKNRKFSVNNNNNININNINSNNTKSEITHDLDDLDYITSEEEQKEKKLEKSNENSFIKEDHVIYFYNKLSKQNSNIKNKINIRENLHEELANFLKKK